MLAKKQKIKFKNTLLLVVVAFGLVFSAGEIFAATYKIDPGLRLRDATPIWAGGANLPELRLNAQALQSFAINREKVVGTLAPNDPRNRNVFYISTVSFPMEGLANYTIYTYHIKRGTLWEFTKIRLSNVTEYESRGLDPIGFVGTNLVFRRITDENKFFPCAVTLDWFAYANRYELLAINVASRDKKLRPFTLPNNIIKNGERAESVCREGLSAVTPDDALYGTGGAGVGVSENSITTIAGCATFARTNPWNRDISVLGVRAESQSWVEKIGAEKYLRLGFGSDAATGIPFNVIGAGSTWYPVRFTTPGSDFSNPGPYPIPSKPLIEAGNDRRLIVLDKRSCYFYEMKNARPDVLTGRWVMDLGAVYYFKAEWLRPQKWPAATASGLPLLPALVKYDEVAAGIIRHPLMFTATVVQKQFISPATAGGQSENGHQPAFGARFRLKSDFDTSRLPYQAKIIAEAMKQYGMYLGDYGEPWTILGTPDPRWKDKDLLELTKISGSAFEVVDNGPFVKIWFE